MVFGRTTPKSAAFSASGPLAPGPSMSSFASVLPGDPCSTSETFLPGDRPVAALDKSALKAPLD
eukprot:9481546-Lingulodinium_polyedra.AAC.1